MNDAPPIAAALLVALLHVVALLLPPPAGADDYLGIVPGTSTADDVRSRLGAPARRFAYPVPAAGFEVDFAVDRLDDLLDGLRPVRGRVLADVWEYGDGETVTERVVFRLGQPTVWYVVAWPDADEETELQVEVQLGEGHRRAEQETGPGCVGEGTRTIRSDPARGLAFVRAPGEKRFAWKVVYPPVR